MVLEFLVGQEAQAALHVVAEVAQRSVVELSVVLVLLEELHRSAVGKETSNA